MHEYSLFIEYAEVFKQDIDAGNEVVLELRELSNWERKVVKAVVNRSYDPRLGADKLFIEEIHGDLRPEPWTIRIVEELDEDQIQSTVYSELRKHGE